MKAPSASALNLEVRRDDLRKTRWSEEALPKLAAGQALLKIDRFAFTANNVTYAAFGDSMAYWNFFPSADKAWGRIPAWGFGDVVASNCPGVQAGERYYGYVPMASHVVLQPEGAGNTGFADAAAHRKPMAAVYNRYIRTSADPGYEAAREAQQILLQPLFITSFMIDDFLADNEFFGATTVVMSSASSKTAYGTAFMLARRGGLEVIGLTSASNLGFVEGLGCYDQVLPYERLEELGNEEPIVYVDFAGSAALRARMHEHFGMYLKYSCAVGGAHWESVAAAKPRAESDEADAEEKPRSALPGARPILFFAPAQIKKRLTDWGPGGLQQRTAAAWRAFMGPVCDPAKPWLKVVAASGREATEKVYRQMLDGKVKPEEGYVLSL